MKVVILAVGFGTRISEESHLKPKPMIEIGEKPILWHIMKYYSQFGYNEFIICLGYKQYVVKEFFADYFLHTSDVTFDLANNSMKVHNHYSEPWNCLLYTACGGLAGAGLYDLPYGPGRISGHPLCGSHIPGGDVLPGALVQPVSVAGSDEVQFPGRGNGGKISSPYFSRCV